MATQEETLTQSQEDKTVQSKIELIRENWLSYAFLIPLLSYMAIFVWYAAVQGLWISLHNWPLFGQKEFVGIQNYREILNMDLFYTSLKATLLYGTQTIPQLIFGTTMALMVWALDSRKISTVVSSVFLLPYVLPPIISGGIFRFLLHPNVGPVQEFLVNQGILQQPIYWMSQGSAALAVVTLVGVWTWTPLIFLLVLASLQGIPSTYYELAEIYGANKWEQFRYITYPQIKSTLILALILRIIWNLGKVAQPLQITRGGPGFKTSMLGVLIYRLAWSQKRFGISFAVGVILALITISIILVFVRQYEKEGGEVQL